MCTRPGRARAARQTARYADDGVLLAGGPDTGTALGSADPARPRLLGQDTQRGAQHRQAGHQQSQPSPTFPSTGVKYG